MKPSFLFIDTYYPAFLDYFYSKNKDIIDKSYDEQKAALMAECFGTANFYSSNLIKLGHQAENIVANNEILQKQWAKEYGMAFKNFPNPHPIRRFPFLNNLIQRAPKFYYWIKDFINQRSWIYQILMTQIKEYQPDILYVLDINFLSPSFLKKARKYLKMVIGQIASRVPLLKNLQSYDLILTSFPHYLEKFKKAGINSEYLKLAFEPEILKAIGPQQKKYQCTFIGGITPDHANTTALLEKLAQKIDINFWGYGKEFLNKSSPVIPKYHGSIWGKAMYKIFAQSKITINRHIDVAENYANNLRLYEATGVGTMLITDMKDNLGEIFEIGKEVETYRTVDELVEKIEFYKKNDTIREKIARAGQIRTLRDHSYQQRARELLRIIQQYL